MNTFYKRILLFWNIFFLCSVVAESHAQNRFAVTHYTGDNGLPQNSIKSITTDSEGFVWTISEDGLVRFDGHRFLVFNKSNLKISSNRFYMMQPSLINNPAAGQGKSRVLYTADENHHFVRIENGKAAVDTLYYKTRLKPIFSATSRGAENVLASGIPHFLSSQMVAASYLIPTGQGINNYYLCDTGRVRYFEKGELRYEAPAAGNSVWNLFTLDRQLFYFNQNGTATLISKWGNAVLPFSGDILRNPAYQGHKNQLQIYWNISSGQVFLYLDKSIYQLSQQDGKLSTRLIVRGFDLKSANIQSVFLDEKSRKLFLGSITQGLYVLTMQSFQTLLTPGDDMENVFYGQLEYESSAVLTPNGFLIRRSMENDSVLSARVASVNQLNRDDKRSMLSDDHGFVWIKSGPKLLRLAKKDFKLHRAWTLESEIKVIYKDKSGYIWIGMTNAGLYGIDPSDPNARPRRFLKNLKVNYLSSASEGRLFVGTERGLYLFEVSRRKCSLVAGTGGLSVKNILAENDAQVWFTVQEKGLMLLGADQKVVAFPLDKNRFLTSPHCVVDDGKGYLWVPTNKGLFQIAKKDLLQYARLKSAGRQMSVTGNTALPAELFYLYHSREEGFRTNEFNGSCQPCGLKLQNGSISLPSLSGLVWFKSEDINRHGPEGSIVLDIAEVNTKALDVSGDTLHFPLNPEYVKLRVSSAYLGNNYNLNLSYALVRKNEVVRPADWVAVDNENPDISFTSLNAGEYTLMVRKLNGFGLNNYTVKRLYFVVPLPWYQTVWARILLVLIVLSCVYAFYVLKVRSIKQENARLETLVGRRTERLNDALLDLESSKKDMSRQIQMLSMLLTSMTHDVQSPLNFIALTSGGIPKMIEEGNLRDVSDLGTLISDSSKRMSLMLRDLLNYIKIQVYGNRMKFEEIDLHALADNKLEIFKNVIRLHESTYENRVPEQLTVFSDYQMLAILVHNLVDNAAKFTHMGKIQIEARHEPGQRVELIIANTAMGLPEEVLELINSADNTIPAEISVKQRKRVGMGLLIVKEVAALLGVSIKISQTDMTRFHLFFEQG